MLVVFYGDNLSKAEQAYKSHISELPVLPIDSEFPNLEEVAKHASIFGDKQIYAGRGVLATEPDIAMLVDSPHQFIFLEPVLPKEIIKRLEKAGAKINEFSLSERELKEGERVKKQLDSRIYKFSDALLVRDRRSLWIAYYRAISQGFDPEELFWKLFWQMKNILLVSSAKSAKEVSMHPFVFDKSRTALNKFTKGELVKFSGNLLDIWSETHSGKKELPISLEQFILSI
ncbi:MAG TPA: hypothetical protein VJK09_02090 [Candidatus Paceibacterota bacterium]